MKLSEDDFLLVFIFGVIALTTIICVAITYFYSYRKQLSDQLYQLEVEELRQRERPNKTYLHVQYFQVTHKEIDLTRNSMWIDLPMTDNLPPEILYQLEAVRKMTDSEKEQIMQ